MKAIRFIVLGVMFPLTWLFTGCGPSATERAAREEKRLELEVQAQREAQKGNAAITKMNQKLGRKPPQLDLGLASETKTETAPSRTPQP